MPLDVELTQLRRRPPDLAALNDFYDSVGFGRLLRNQAERIAGRAERTSDSQTGPRESRGEIASYCDARDPNLCIAASRSVTISRLLSLQLSHHCKLRVVFCAELPSTSCAAFSAAMEVHHASLSLPLLIWVCSASARVGAESARATCNDLSLRTSTASHVLRSALRRRSRAHTSPTLRASALIGAARLSRDRSREASSAETERADARASRRDQAKRAEECERIQASLREIRSTDARRLQREEGER